MRSSSLFWFLSHDDRLLLVRLYGDQELEVDNIHGTRAQREIMRRFNKKATSAKLVTIAGTSRLLTWLRKNRTKLPRCYQLKYKPKSRGRATA
jgi:hypothetical protein